MAFLVRALESLPAAATSPLAFLAYIFTVGIWAWAVIQTRRLEKVNQGMKEVPESQRPAFLRTSLNTVVPSSISATQWIKAEKQRYVFLSLIAILVLILCLAGLAAWAVRSDSGGAKADIAPAIPKATTLVLTATKKGWQTTEGSLHEFTLSNPLFGLAIVESIEVEVLEVIENKWATTQALVDTYKYNVELDPAFRGLKKFASDFKYSPGEVDRISVLLKSKAGFDYFVRFVVSWDDVLKKEKMKTYSDVQAASFPTSENPQNLDRDAMGEGSLQHSKEVEELLKALRDRVKENSK
jgi:hypothetical protein